MSSHVITDVLQCNKSFGISVIKKQANMFLIKWLVCVNFQKILTVTVEHKHLNIQGQLWSLLVNNLFQSNPLL